jgi:hypothetical protein
MHLEYYRYLNCGYKLPLVGGTDKMSASVPVGMYRTYVHIPDDEPFTFDNWCKHMRGGDTFLSSGPLLRFRVNGQPMGHTIKLPGNGGAVDVEASAVSLAGDRLERESRSSDRRVKRYPQPAAQRAHPGREALLDRGALRRSGLFRRS